MREIKFRAWTHKGFTYWALPSNGFMRRVEAGEPQPQAWQQYTGLKDKNGVEIYEGDIVKAEWTGSLPKQPKLVLAPVEFAYAAFRCSGDPLYLYETLEVIGNVYENPELLE